MNWQPATRLLLSFLAFSSGAYLLYIEFSIAAKKINTDIYALNDPASYLFTPWWLICFKIVVGLAFVAAGVLCYFRKINRSDAAMLAMLLTSIYLATYLWW